jgi:DAK2 domain fusion protein YloV
VTEVSVGGTRVIAVPDSFDAVAVRQWCALGLAALRRHQREIDDLNVYPVPDGDTGTNLVLTVSAAVEAIPAHADGAAAEVLRALARGALLGARGNSGVILSQLLRGLADALAALPAADGRAFAGALTAAADAAYRAVATPVEGTVLTVARAAADAASAADSDDLGVVVGAAATAAREALARTPEQLPALARAGVVDAGGRGLCVLLDALAEVVTGTAVPEGRPYQPPHRMVPARERRRAREAGSGDFAYEVQYLLEAGDAAVEGLRTSLATLGDSLVVVGTGDGTWNVHVHVNDVGGAIEAGVVAGRPYRIAVTRFDDQMAEAGADPDARAVVVLGGGAGMSALFESEGAEVVTAMAGGTPSTAEILAAIRATGAGNVVVLPNDPNAAAVAAAAAKEARDLGVHTAVVRTRSPVQALAALAVRDGTRRFDDDVIEMAEAAGACRYAEVTIASRAALTMVGPCEPGDVIALIEGEVSLIGPELAGVCNDLLDRMLAGGGELVTLVTGAEAPAGLAAGVTDHLTRHHPFVEVHTHGGGQPHYPLLVGVE